MNELDVDKSFLKKSTLFNILGTVLKICGPLLTIMLARIFGAGEFGIFVSTQGLLLTIARASTLGLDIGLRWYMPQNKLHGRVAYSGIMESFWISVAVSLFVTIVIILGSFTPFISDELPYYAISLVFYSGMYVLSSSSEGNRKPWISIFINDFIIAVMAPLVSIILHYLDIPHALPFGLLFGQVIGFTLHAKAVRKQFKKMPIVPQERISKELVLYSVPLGLTVLVGNLLQRSTLWMVLFFLGDEASGVYALMMTLANGLQTIRNGFNPIITPVVSGMEESRLKTDLKPVYSYCVSMATMIQVIIGFFIVLFPEEIMSIAGKSYVVQPMALGVLLFFQLVVTFFGMVNTVIDGIGKSVVNLKASVIQLLTSVVVGFILIPQLGLLGAALSMLIYGIVSSVYCNVYLLKRKLQPYSSKLWIDIVWMVLLLTLYILINAQVVTLTMVGKIVVYVCVLLLLGAQFLFYKRKF